MSPFGAPGSPLVPSNSPTFREHSQMGQSPTRIRSSTHNPQPYYHNPVSEPITTIVTESNRSRSSSWPRPPPPELLLSQPSPPNGPTQAHRTRSSGTRSRPGTPPRKASDSPATRKKRKRLNPQRRSFYKSLHSDFPTIADALRDARQGVDVIQTLKDREILFSTIEARPPQDPTNLNVRRYNDMVFIWDPSMESWLQVPGNGRIPDLEASGAFFGASESEQNAPDFPLQMLSASEQGDEGPFRLPETGYIFDRSFMTESDTSEDEELQQRAQRSRSMNDFLPTDLLNDFM
jgi:hypothetical protein